MLNIRQAGADDYEDIVRCIKDIYGLFYSRQEMYSESYFKDSIQSKDLIIYVIENQNEVMGLIGFTYPVFCERVYDFGLYMVKKEYQHSGIGIMLFDYAKDLLLAAKHPVEYANATTIHTASQKLIEERAGFICTGFVFAMVLHEESGRVWKETMTFHTLKKHKTDCGVIHIPQCLNGIAKKVYDSLKVNYSIRTDEQPLYGRTAARHWFDGYARTLHIKLAECGTDLIVTLQSLERDFNSGPLFSSVIYLDMKSSSAVLGYKKLIAAGYIFSGFKPLYYEEEFIILCNLNGADIGLDRIRLTQKSQLMLQEVLRVEYK